tara:strand:+ start:284 stop:1345 length:1062 start_codon:yes stop_codon:yes gene_type:complete
MKILVTGCGGFIGSHVSEYLLNRGDVVIGIDNLNDYYDINLKIKNINLLNNFNNFKFYKENVLNSHVISQTKPDKICHLASMAGVRYSIKNPCIYVRENIEAFIYLLEEAIKNNVKHIVYASSSSVYGLNTKIPFNEEDIIEKCNSPYACSKKSMEIFAKTYYQLHNISNIGLRFFTVYGPRGRPDMAPYKFLNAIINNKEFDKYGDGNTFRDYTYIDDIVSGVISSIDNINNLQCEIINLGNSKKITLNEFISSCEKVTKKKAKFNKCENQMGDVPGTCADISKAIKLLNYKPKIDLLKGLEITYDYINNIKEDEFCQLGDCSKPECHNCFPIKNCTKHDICIKEGFCDPIN